MEREAEEQRVIKLQITMREDEIKRDLERTEERERRRAEGLPVIYLGPVFFAVCSRLVAVVLVLLEN